MGEQGTDTPKAEQFSSRDEEREFRVAVEHDPHVLKALDYLAEAEERIADDDVLKREIAQLDGLLDDYSRLLKQRAASPDVQQPELDAQLGETRERIQQVQKARESLTRQIEHELDAATVHGEERPAADQQVQERREHDELRQELARVFFNLLADTESELSHLWVKIDPLPASITRTTLATIYISIRQDHDRLLEDVPTEDLQRDPRQASLETWKKLVTRASRLRGRIKPLADLVEQYTHGQAG